MLIPTDRINLQSAQQRGAQMMGYTTSGDNGTHLSCSTVKTTKMRADAEARWHCDGPRKRKAKKPMWDCFFQILFEGKYGKICHDSALSLTTNKALVGTVPLYSHIQNMYILLHLYFSSLCMSLLKQMVRRIQSWIRCAHRTGTIYSSNSFLFSTVLQRSLFQKCSTLRNKTLLNGIAHKPNSA